MFFLEHSGATDTGRVRQNNEDSLLAGEGRDPTLLAVADGIGGFEAGEVASSIAIGVLRELEPQRSFTEAVREANSRILTAAREDSRRAGMGTTLVALRLSGRGGPEIEVVHVGDSRAYLLRGVELSRLTEDHSLVAELVKSGDLTQDEAEEHPHKNLITRALGAEEEVEADVTTVRVQDGDRLLLCSDGLSDMVPDERIREILSTTRGDPQAASRNLISEALEAGGLDNVTVIVADVRKKEEPRLTDTTELGVTAPPEGTRGNGPGRAELEAKRARALRARRRKRRRQRVRRIVSAAVRGVAALIVVAALLTPGYIWASSRYYLSFEGGRVVVHQGLPYTVGGVKLSRVFRKTTLKESEIKKPYRAQIREHRLYSRHEIRRILSGLRSS
ncbi:Stp1/IreP family PP2C-type Ser/Thr phosphatase [Rubrobacter calidifluminis]|uniref:Stp1/IreP family PP2C-type Ser/Thr phosphatase n=1 Tax=Rubrobacter calidifluminis TaxID=1392640 RepID=UPI002360E229|nr:Stp1/IreP family PP2C-type Ser/Thr phosphatase [Rubrobacter calidifluminis]